MNDVTEVMRMPSPAPRPQSLAFDGETLWMGSLETVRLYGIDPQHWTVREEARAPGTPWGMTVMGDELRVVCSDGPDDNRVIRRFTPGHGFHTNGSIQCPDGTGSQLGYDGERLYVSQWYNKRILSLDKDGNVGTVIDTPRGICGQVIVGGVFYALTTDTEETGPYFVTRIDARNGAPKVADVGHIPFAARSLAYDGSRFWTNHREQHEIVAFSVDAM